MRVVFVTNEYETDLIPAGGLGTFTANVARIFAEHGNDVTVLVVTTKELKVPNEQYYSIINIFVELEDWKQLDLISKIYYPNDKHASDVNRGELLTIMKAKLVKDRLNEMNEQKRIDIVHFCNHGALSFFMDNSIPYVIRISGFLSIFDGKANIPGGSISFVDNPVTIQEQLDNSLVQRARFVICPSNLFSHIAQEGLNVKADVIESPFVLDNSKLDPCIVDQRLNGKEYFLYYGTLSFRKGIHILAELVVPFLSRHKNICIVLAGIDRVLDTDKYGRILASEYITREAGCYADRIIYLGAIKRKQLYPIIQKALFCVFPSRIENLSNSCIEAMALGKVVIATDGASYEQLIENEVSGYLCKRDDPSSFLDAMEEVMSLADLQKRVISENAKRRIDALNPERIYQKYYSYYERVIKEWSSEDMI